MTPALSNPAGSIVPMPGARADRQIEVASIRLLRQIATPSLSAHAVSSRTDTPAAPIGIPRILRDHVGQRQFGDFGAVLLADRSASADLSNHVARRRAADRRDDLPLRAHPDQTAEDRRFNFLFVVTPIVIMLWALIGLMTAWLKGML